MTMKSLEVGLACLLVCCLLATTVEYHRNHQEPVVPLSKKATMELVSQRGDGASDFPNAAMDYVPDSHPVFASTRQFSQMNTATSATLPQDVISLPFPESVTLGSFSYFPFQSSNASFGKLTGSRGILLCYEVQ